LQFLEISEPSFSGVFQFQRWELRSKEAIFILRNRIYSRSVRLIGLTVRRPANQTAGGSNFPMNCLAIIRYTFEQRGLNFTGSDTYDFNEILNGR